MIRYGLVGSGMMGQEHIKNIKMLGDVEITAIADPDPDMLDLSLRTLGKPANVYADYREMLRDDLCDVYLIVSPNDTHYEILLDLIPLNKPILCEKPLCTTVQHCKEISKLAAESTAPIWVAMEYRYMPPVQSLIQEVENNTAGPLKMMSIREHRFPFLPKVGDWNRFNRRTGGTLTEKCCHFWDLMRFVLKSDPIRVFASGAVDVNHLDEQYQGEVPDIIDNAYVIVDFENGARAMLDLCMFAEGSYWQEVISVTGPKARVDALIPGPARFSGNGQERDAKLVISDRQSKRESVQTVHVDESVLQAGDHHGSTFFQHQKFLDMVLKGQNNPEVSLRDGLIAVQVGEAAERSARTGQAIVLENLG